jgi:transcription elongation factor GreA
MTQSALARVRTAESLRSRTHAHTPAPTLDVAELRARISDQLNHLSAALMSRIGENAERSLNVRAADTTTLAIQERIRRLGQLAAGLAIVDSDTLPAARADYGSTVIGEELFTRQRHEYTLMVGALVDIDAGEVSLGSPIGQALLGRQVGDLVEVELPNRTLRLRIVSVATLGDVLGDVPAG